MKKIKFLIVAILFLYTSLYGQNLWQNEISLNFTVQSNTKVTSFVDVNGIHIVYTRNGGIRYALVNSQGGIIKYDKVIEADGSGTDFANVVAIDNNVYAISYKNNKIKVAISTNLGDSWNNNYSYFDCINTGCNKILAYRDGNVILVTWSEKRIGSYDNDVHFIRFTPQPNPTWNNYRCVSELNPNGGDNPDLVEYSRKIYVNYITSFWQPINRDRNPDNNWNNPETIPFNQFPLTNIVKKLKLIAVGNQLNTVYMSVWNGWDESGVIISHSYKNLNGNTWIQDPNYLESDWYSSSVFPLVTTNTSDGKIHLIYYDKYLPDYSYRTIINHSFRVI